MSNLHHGTERQRLFESRVNRILERSLAQQAQCVMLAAELALPVWLANEKDLGIEGTADQFIACFRRWLVGNATDEEFEESSKPLEQALPGDLRTESNPAAGMAGFALIDVRMIALDQCEDVHIDIMFTSLCYAVAVACGGAVSYKIGWTGLTDAHLDLLDAWFVKCEQSVLC